MIRTALIICNVGGILFQNESTYWAAFLARMSDGQYFIVIRKQAATIEGTPYPEGFGLVTKESLANATHNIPAFIVAKLAIGTYDNFAPEMENFGRFKVSVFNEAAIIAMTTTVRGLTELKACPPAYTIKGASTAQSVVDELSGTDQLSEPVNTGTSTGGGLIISANATAYPTLDKAPIEAAKAAFGNPIEYAKANPISAGFMVLGGIELGNQLGLWKFSVLKSVGILKKGKR